MLRPSHECGVILGAAMRWTREACRSKPSRQGFAEYTWRRRQRCMNQHTVQPQLSALGVYLRRADVVVCRGDAFGVGVGVGARARPRRRHQQASPPAARARVRAQLQVLLSRLLILVANVKGATLAFLLSCSCPAGSPPASPNRA